MRTGGFQFQAGDLAAFCESEDGSDSVVIWCPGCSMLHSLRVRPGDTPGQPLWSWNQSLTEPTFVPSLLCRWDRITGPQGATVAEARVCHSYIRGGHIEFLADSTHVLAGQTVPLAVPSDLRH
jgi:hypothetical protein